MKSTGFEIPVDGKMKVFPPGADVPDEIVKAYKLSEKGLVTPASGADIAGSASEVHPEEPAKEAPE